MWAINSPLSSFTLTGSFVATANNYSPPPFASQPAGANSGVFSAGATANPFPKMWFAGMFARSDGIWGTQIGQDGFTSITEKQHLPRTGRNPGVVGCAGALRVRSIGSLEAVFELQDKIASNVAGVIEPTLQAAETYSRPPAPPLISPPTTSICAASRVNLMSASE